MMEMEVVSKGWPDGLADGEAVQRLQTLCMGACDGIQDLADDTRYKALRRCLLARADLRPLAPSFVAAQPNLPALVRHLREERSRQDRRERVRSEFALLKDEVGEPTTLRASRWTGRSTLLEQATVVRALAPAAVEAVERLIRDEELLRDNGGPVDPDREQALFHLRALHSALGDLIRLAQTEKPLTESLERIRALRQEAKVTLGRVAAAAPVTGSVLLAFGTVAGIADFFVGSTVMSLAAGTLAGTTVKDVLLRGGGTEE